MPVISESYREQNRKLHDSKPFYGAGTVTSRWYEGISRLAQQMGATSVLDYGCGKGKFGLACPHLNVTNYDPAIRGLEQTPEPADMVVCLDVLEHIEPECLDDVLDDIKRCARRAVFLTVATRPAKKVLEDGRNAHLIQENFAWWAPKITARWDVRMMQSTGGEFVVFAIPYAEAKAERVAA
jgi:2-polyprenyl-3-methyl-5-hydroxy-6-metoxy-1,4-benzoquinol methylase